MLTGLGLQQSLQQRQILAPQLQLAMQLLPLNLIQLEQYLHKQVFTNPCIAWRGPNSGEKTAYEVALSTQSHQPDLHEHLLGQAQLEPVSSMVLLALEALIDGLEEDGYLRQNLSSIISQSGLTPTPKKADWLAAKQLLHQLDPSGIGAADLQECLILQLKYSLDIEHQANTATNQIAQKILLEHFELLSGGGSKAALAQELNESVNLVHDALDLIKHLNARPTAGFQNNTTTFVRPDIHLFLASNNTWQAELIDKLSDKINIHQATDGSKENWNQARQLMQAIKLRELNLQSIADQLVNIQADFLIHGEAKLEPLTQQQLADKLALHASTISRAVRHKFALYNGQLLPLQAFFSHAVAGKKSAVATKAYLQQLIANENPQRPLSDAILCKKMRINGYPIARRTVLKYRQQLNIPNSRQRVCNV